MCSNYTSLRPSPIIKRFSFWGIESRQRTSVFSLLFYSLPQISFPPFAHWQSEWGNSDSRVTGSFSSVQFSRSVVSDSFRSQWLQHARLPCPSPTPGAYSNSCPLSQWCHPNISSSDIPFCSHLQSFPASGSFQMSQLFTSGGQRTGVSASTSVFPMNTQDWSHLGWTGWISLQSKGLSRVFSNTTFQKHQFFGAQLS